MMRNNNGVEVLRLNRLSGDSKLKAFADVSFAGVFIVRGLKVVEGKNGLFVDMPSKVDKGGKWHKIAYPITKEFNGILSETVLQAYQITP